MAINGNNFNPGERVARDGRASIFARPKSAKAFQLELKEEIIEASRVEVIEDLSPELKDQFKYGRGHKAKEDRFVQHEQEQISSNDYWKNIANVKAAKVQAKPQSKAELYTRLEKAEAKIAEAKLEIGEIRDTLNPNKPLPKSQTASNDYNKELLSALDQLGRLRNHHQNELGRA